MEHEDIRKLIIKNGGYLALTKLKKAFEQEDAEILEMNLTFLIDKNRVRKANYRASSGSDTLYYIPE